MSALHAVVIKNNTSQDHAKEAIAHLKDYTTPKRQKNQINHVHVPRSKFDKLKKFHDPNRKGITYIVGELKEKNKPLLNGYGMNSDIEESMNTTNKTVKQAFNNNTPANSPSINNKQQEMINKLKDVQRLIGGSEFTNFLHGLTNTVSSIAEPLSIVAPEIGIPLTVGSKVVDGITSLFGDGLQKKKRGRPKKNK